MDGRLERRKVIPGQSDQQGDEYNPFLHRPPGPRTSDFATLIHLLKSALGNGILFLPNGFRRTGYLMSLICGICMGLLCTHTISLLVRSAQELCVRHRVPMLDFAKTAELSIEGGPERFRKYGKNFGVFTNVLICFVHYQACVIYTLYVATSFQQVIEFFTGVELDTRVYVIALYPILCLLGYTPDLKYLAPFSVIGFAFLLSGVSITVYYLLQGFPDPGRLTLFTHVLSIPMYCNLVLYALHNATLVLPLENTMENPQKLPRLIVINMVLNTFLCTLFGFLGYNKYMNDTCDTVIKNLPIEETLAQSIKVTIALSVLLSFGLAYYVPVIILWPMIESRVSPTSWGLNAFRLFGVTMTIIVAIAVPYMVPLLGLLASFSMTSIMLLIPIVVDIATKWERATRLMCAKSICIFVVYAVSLIFGSVESVIAIIKAYGAEKEEGC